MKKLNLVELISALFGLVVVLVLPYFKFSFLGMPLYRITAVNVIGGMYPIFLLPVFGMLVMAILSFSDLRPFSIVAGVLVLIIQVVFMAMRTSIILNGDLTVLINQAKGLMDQVGAGSVSEAEIRMILTPLLKADLGFYLGLVCNVIYLLGGLVFADLKLGGSGSSHAGRSFNGNESKTSVEGRRKF